MNVQVEIIEDNGPPVIPPQLTWWGWYKNHFWRLILGPRNTILDELKHAWSFIVVIGTFNIFMFAIMSLMIFVDVLVRLVS